MCYFMPRRPRLVAMAAHCRICGRFSRDCMRKEILSTCAATFTIIQPFRKPAGPRCGPRCDPQWPVLKPFLQTSLMTTQDIITQLRQFIRAEFKIGENDRDFNDDVH